jgi:hypothetical protein
MKVKEPAARKPARSVTAGGTRPRADADDCRPRLRRNAKETEESALEILQAAFAGPAPGFDALEHFADQVD